MREKFSLTRCVTRCRKYRCKTKGFKNWNAYAKRQAHKSVRRKAKNFDFENDSFSPKPGMTGWDVC